MNIVPYGKASDSEQRHLPLRRLHESGCAEIITVPQVLDGLVALVRKETKGST